MKYLLSFFLLIIANPVSACFSGYYAPEFLEVTNPIIGTSIIVTMFSIFIAVKKKAFIRAILAIFIYLLISYYGHFMYVGDCGNQIVSLNKVALFFVVLWLSIEITLVYINDKNKKA